MATTTDDDTTMTDHTLADLTAFDVDLLLAVPAADPYRGAGYEGELPSGATVRDELERRRGEYPTAVTFFKHVKTLEDRGLLEREPIGSAKGIRLTDAGVAWVQGLANAASEAVFEARGGGDE